MEVEGLQIQGKQWGGGLEKFAIYLCFVQLLHLRLAPSIHVECGLSFGDTSLRDGGVRGPFESFPSSPCHAHHTTA